ncbi:hypothetical protein LY76DRAFT_429232 [Colletotrichum caudatum]|nr:hypothetical protein LY76DRAFT_429232 [Colletotrichum caudatum]
MGGGSNLGGNDFQRPPSSIQPNGFIHERPRITQLPGVFVPSCNNGSVIYPSATQKNPTPQRRVSIVPPAPSTTLNCSLLSHGDDATMDWVPQASPVFRRPSRCMSVGEIGVDSTSSESVEEIDGEAESAVVSGETDSRPPSGPLDPYLARDGAKTEETIPTASHQPSSMASVRSPTDIASDKDAGTVPQDPKSVFLDKNTETPGRSGYTIWGKSHTRMQRIMAKVRDHLAGHRKTEAIPPEETNLPTDTCSRNSCQYVLDDSQVQGIVEMVFQEMCKHDFSSQSMAAGETHQAIDDSVPKWLSRKPSCLKSSIEPQPSTTVDPATTISEPETSFVARSASDGQVYSKTRPQQVPCTTIFCQGSSTDIQWSDDSGTGLLDTSTVSEPSRTPGPAATQQTPDFHGFPLDPQIESKSSLEKENMKEFVTHGDDDKSRRMTSFPTLSERHCTKDWLSPPVNLIDSRNGADMYHLGIDARSNSIPSISRELAAEQAQQPCEASDSLLASAESGKQQPAQLANSLTKEYPGPEHGFMQKLSRKISSVFQGSDSVSRPTRAPAPSEIEGQVSGKLTEALGASRPLAGDQGPDAGSFSEPEPNTVYQAMTLSRPSKGGPQRRSTCSEDNIPHQCDDDISTSGVTTPCAEATS